MSRNGGKGKEMNKELMEAPDILEKEKEISAIIGHPFVLSE